MNKLLFAFTTIFFISACTTSFSTLDQAIPKLKGQHVDVAIEHLGMPDKKYTIDNKDVYLWSNIESHISTSTAPTQTYGNIGNTTFSAYTTNYSSQSYDLRCEIKVVTEKKIIKSFEYSGNNGACFRYSNIANGAAPESLVLGLVSVLRHVLPDEELKAYCFGAKSCEPLLKKLEEDVSIDVLNQKLGHWDKLKMTLHSQFLNKKTFDQLRVEYEMITKTANEHNRQSSQGDKIESVRARHRYLSEVLRMTDARDYGIVEPASEFVYKGLEQASYLTGN